MAASECRDLESLLQPYVDGEFEADDKVQLEVHLAHCEACRTRVDQERRLRARLRAAVAACAGFIAYLELPQLLVPLFDDAVRRHSQNLPLEVAGDEQRVQRWFEGKVDFNVQVPRFRNVNLQGGRLSHIAAEFAAVCAQAHYGEAKFARRHVGCCDGMRRVAEHEHAFACQVIRIDAA